MDPSFWPAYARALERVIEGDFEGPSPSQPLDGPGYTIFTESYVADANMLPEYDQGCQWVGGYLLSTASGETIAWMVDVDWAEAWDPENAEEIYAALSLEFKSLLEVARDRGYQYILLWP